MPSPGDRYFYQGPADAAASRPEDEGLGERYFHKPTRQRGPSEIEALAQMRGAAPEEYLADLKAEGYQPSPQAAQSYKIGQRRRQLSQEGVGTIQAFKQFYQPFGSIVSLPVGGRSVGNREYQKALEAFKRGEATDDQLDAIATREALDEANARVAELGVAGKVAQTAGGLGQVLPEVAVGGVALQGLKIGGRAAISAFRAPRVAAAATETRSVAGAIDAAVAEGKAASKSGLRRLGEFAGYQTALTPFTPSQFVPMAQEINMREGRDANSIVGFPTAFVYGVAQNMVLGHFQNGVRGSYLAAGIKKGPIAVAELAAVEDVARLFDEVLPKKYQTGIEGSAVSKVIRGISKRDDKSLKDGLETAVAQALTFGLLGAMTRRGSRAEELGLGKSRPRVLEAIDDTINKLKERGLDEEQAGLALRKAHDLFESYMVLDPYAERARVKERLVDDVSDPTIREYLTTLADETIPDKPFGRMAEATVYEKETRQGAVRATPPEVNIPIEYGGRGGLGGPAEGLIDALSGQRQPGMPQAQTQPSGDPSLGYSLPAGVRLHQTPPTPPPDGASAAATPAPQAPEGPTGVRPPDTGAPETPTVPTEPGAAPEPPGSPPQGEAPQGPEPTQQAPDAQAGATGDQQRPIMKLAQESLAAAANLTDAQRVEFGRAFADAFESASPDAQKLIEENVSAFDFHPDQMSVLRAFLRDKEGKEDVEKEVGEYLASGNAMAAAYYDHRTGKLVADGSMYGVEKGAFPAFEKTDAAIPSGLIPAREFMIHEIGHSVDRKSKGKFRYSSTPEWFWAQKEINGKKGEPPPLTEYARDAADPMLKRAEGFAEFFRIVHDRRFGTAQIEAAFPKGVEFFRANKLWPQWRDDAATRNLPYRTFDEVFNKRSGPADGHVDLTVKTKTSAADKGEPKSGGVKYVSGDGRRRYVVFDLGDGNIRVDEVVGDRDVSSATGPRSSFDEFFRNVKPESGAAPKPKAPKTMSVEEAKKIKEAHLRGEKVVPILLADAFSVLNEVEKAQKAAEKLSAADKPKAGAKPKPQTDKQLLATLDILTPGGIRKLMRDPESAKRYADAGIDLEAELKRREGQFKAGDRKGKKRTSDTAVPAEVAASIEYAGLKPNERLAFEAVITGNSLDAAGEKMGLSGERVRVLAADALRKIKEVDPTFEKFKNVQQAVDYYGEKSKKDRIQRGREETYEEPPPEWERDELTEMRAGGKKKKDPRADLPEDVKSRVGADGFLRWEDPWPAPERRAWASIDGGFRFINLRPMLGEDGVFRWQDWDQIDVADVPGMDQAHADWLGDPDIAAVTEEGITTGRRLDAWKRTRVENFRGKELTPEELWDYDLPGGKAPNDEAQFLRAIQKQPTESINHASFADWLEERGRTAEADSRRRTAQMMRFVKKFGVVAPELWAEHPDLELKTWNGDGSLFTYRPRYNYDNGRFEWGQWGHTFHVGREDIAEHIGISASDPNFRSNAEQFNDDLITPQGKEVVELPEDFLSLMKITPLDLPEEVAFKRAIGNEPTESTAHFLYADWLDEHDRPVEAEQRRITGQLMRFAEKGQRVIDLVFPGDEDPYGESGAIWARHPDMVRRDWHETSSGLIEVVTYRPAYNISEGVFKWKEYRYDQSYSDQTDRIAGLLDIDPTLPNQWDRIRKFKSIGAFNGQEVNEVPGDFLSPMRITPLAAAATRKVKAGARAVKEAVADPMSDPRKWVRRFLTTAGGLTEGQYQANVDRLGKVHAKAENVRQAERDLSKALGGFKNVDESLARKMNTALLVGTPEGLAAAASLRSTLANGEEVVRALTQMGEEVKSLSARLIEAGVVQGQLATVVGDNLGAYLTRQYRVFQDPKWATRVPVEVKNRFISWLRNELTQSRAENGLPPPEEAELQAITRSLLVDGTAADNPIAFIAKSKLGSTGPYKLDLTILKKRKEIPEELRALWGEVEDPLANYAATVGRMTYLLANHEFLTRVAREGRGTVFFEKGELAAFEKLFPGEPAVEMAADASEAMGPLAGLYTTAEIRDAFARASSREEVSGWMRPYMKFLAATKYSKTVLSPTTHLRNFFGNVFFAMANGHWRFGGFGAAVRALSSDSPQARAKRTRMLELGVIGDAVLGNEFAAVVNDAFGRQDSWSEASVLDRYPKNIAGWLRRGANWMQKLYQSEDAVWKIFAFDNEVARYSKAHPEWTAEQVERKAASVVRDTYPSYSKVPELVKGIRRVPLVGSFVSFPSEVIRTTYKTFALVKEEMANPATRSIGKARLAGLMASGFASAAASMSTALFLGVTAQDNEDIRRHLPDWSKNSMLLYMGRGENGSVRYVDLSRNDPHAHLSEAVVAFLRSGDPREAAAAVAKPFIEEEIGTRAVVDVARNTREEGGRVYNPQDTASRRYADVARHLAQPSVPGAFTTARRIGMAVAGAREQRTGRGYDTADEIVGALGLRVSETKPLEDLRYKSKTFVESKTDAAKILTAILSAGGDVSQEEVVSAAARAEAARARAFSEFRADILAAERLGVSRESIKKSLTASGVSREDVADLLSGRLRPWKPDLRSKGKTYRERAGMAR